ncbi:MAG: PQQ-like beta-propeller repeat protein [Verrucomicrobiae bacterium]|nr:PQQ-like beta-propeller repeat protein [Verrucomicrobiae bacterium]
MKRAAPLPLAPGLFTFLALSIVASPAEETATGNWPRFRGPDGAGVSADTAVPLTWSESENLKWRADLPGPGSSSPIVWGDRVFVTCYSGYGVGQQGGGDPLNLNRHLLCFDAGNGQLLWEKTIPAPLPEDEYRGFIAEHGYASQTPVTDGERVYVYFGKGGALAFDFDGKELWKADLGSRPSSKGWGTSTSPILHGDTVIVNAAEESNAVYALDKKTGNTVWKSEAEPLVSIYGAPVIEKVADDRDDLILSVPGEVWGMNPATGKLRWYAGVEVTGNIAASPVLAGGRIIQFGGYPRTMGVAVKSGGKGDVSESSVLWHSNDAKSYLTSPVYFEGKLYWVSDAGIAGCADPETGEIVFEERVPELNAGGGGGGRGKPFYASPIVVNGHLVAVSRTAGAFVMAAKPEFEFVRVNRIAGDDSRFQGTPAVANGKLYLRSEKAIYCVGQ